MQVRCLCTHLQRCLRTLCVYKMHHLWFYPFCIQCRSIAEEQCADLEKEKTMRELEIKENLQRYKKDINEKNNLISQVTGPAQVVSAIFPSNWLQAPNLISQVTGPAQVVSAIFPSNWLQAPNLISQVTGPAQVVSAIFPSNWLQAPNLISQVTGPAQILSAIFPSNWLQAPPQIPSIACQTWRIIWYDR